MLSARLPSSTNSPNTLRAMGIDLLIISRIPSVVVLELIRLIHRLGRLATLEFVQLLLGLVGLLLKLLAVELLIAAELL